jgi:hypothetical protein
MVDFIHIADQAAELMPGTQLDLSFKCPVFDQDSAARSYSLPHRLAASPEMLTRSKNLHRLDTAVDSETLPEKIFIGQQLLASGDYIVEKMNPQYIDGHFENSAKQYASDLANTKLHELLPVVEIPQDLNANWGIVVEWQQNFAGKYFEMWINEGKISYTAKPNDTPLNVALYFAERIRTDYKLPVSTTFSRIDITSKGEKVRLHPWLPDLQGLFLQSDWRTYAQARQENFHNFIESCLETPREDVSFAFMRNPRFYDSKNLQWVGDINPHYKVIGSDWASRKNAFIKISEESVATKGHWEYAFVPFVRVRYILDLIAKSLDLAGIAGGFEEWTDLMAELVVYNTFALDEVVQEWQFNLADKTEAEKAANVGVTKIELKNHVPDMTAREFLQDFCDTFNLFWDDIEGRLFFKKKDDLLRGMPSELIQHKLVPNSIEKALKKRQGLSLKFKKEDNDTATVLAAYTEGEGKTSMELPVGILAERFDFLSKSCYAEQIGTSGVSKNSSSSFGLRFMLDKGIQFRSDDLLQYYQSATDNKNSKDEPINNLSLTPTALYTWAWHEHARIKAYGFPINFKVNLDIIDLQILKAWKTAVYRLETPEGAIVAALDTLSVIADENGLKETKITAFGRF